MACHDAGLRAVAVTAGYMLAEARADMYAAMDAANVDLKAFDDDFYRRVCSARLAPVLETITYLVTETPVWVELTTLLIPGLNDSSAEIDRLTTWVADALGPDVPVHFTAFHPDFKMRDRPPTPPETLTRARGLAMRNGLRYVYTGNVHDRGGGCTICPGCGVAVVERDWYTLLSYRITDDGRCTCCGTTIAGVFDGPAGDWGARRVPVHLGEAVP